MGRVAIPIARRTAIAIVTRCGRPVAARALVLIACVAVRPPAALSPWAIVPGPPGRPLTPRLVAPVS